jgi:hypothetical protein
MGALILLESTLAKREGRVVKKKRKDPSRWWMSRKKRKESRTWGATEREFDRIARAERLIAKLVFRWQRFEPEFFFFFRITARIPFGELESAHNTT